MLFFYILIIPLALMFLKLVIYLIVSKFGKISYDGFNALGFKYNEKKDVFYTAKNAWQKNFGYTRLYDVACPIFNMIIDVEPIKFYYNHKNWLISFWKGQYGMTTGGEIGIYNTKELKVNKNTLYLPISNEEMLDMCFTLYHKHDKVMRVCAKHWWLAAFKLGMFSRPKDLTMDISITFPNKEMLTAFLTAFKKKGYKEKDYQVSNTTFCFTFKKPKTHKVWTRGLMKDSIVQKINRNNVELYNKLLKDTIDDNQINDTNSTSQMLRVNDFIPDILKNKEMPKEVESRVKTISDKNVLILNSEVYHE